MHRLHDLEHELKQSMEDLIHSEVRAGRDTVQYIQESEKEVHVLQMELDEKTAYAAKLENDIVLAIDAEHHDHQAWEDSIEAVHEAEEEREEHRAWYMSEVERLRNDVEVVDEVISIFL